MNDTMSLLLATTILAAGGLGLYMYKSSDTNEKGGDDDYDEGSLFGSGNLWGSKEDDNVNEDYETEEVYEPKPRVKASKTKRRKASGGTKRRY
jgi:hypothetical protein